MSLIVFSVLNLVSILRNTVGYLPQDAESRGRTHRQENVAQGMKSLRSFIGRVRPVPFLIHGW